MRNHKWWVFLAISLLSFGCYLDYTVVNVALPTIQKELHSNLTQLQWVMNIYFLALCILATIMGSCGDIYGRRRMLYIGGVIFGIASLVAGFSTHILTLILGRLLQGIGAAIVIPIGPSLLPEAFPEHQRGKSIAWLGSLGGIALALGPVLGGFIVTYLNWRWVFFINIPIVVAGLLIALPILAESKSSNTSNKLDWMGMLLLTLTMGGIVLGLIHSQVVNWKDIVTWIYLFVGFVSGIALYKIETKQLYPLIDFKDFANPLFYAGASLCFLAGVMSSVALFFDPLYLQVIRQQSPEFSGIVLFAIPIAVFLGALTVGWLVDKFGIIKTICIGLLFAITASILHLFFSATTPLWFIIIAFAALGYMWAMGNTVSIIAAQTATGPQRSSVATGTVVTMFNVGGSIGLAVSIVIYNLLANQTLNNLDLDSSMQLEHLIANPAQALQPGITPTIYTYFENAFLHGFAGTMGFLLFTSSIILVTILAASKRSQA